MGVTLTPEITENSLPGVGDPKTGGHQVPPSVFFLPPSRAIIDRRRRGVGLHAPGGGPFLCR